MASSTDPVKRFTLPLVQNQVEPDQLHPLRQVKSKFPPWLHRRVPTTATLFETDALVHQKRLHTVCEEARCPNLVECYSKKTATFLLLGNECTRACGFCEIAYRSTPKEPDPQEALRVVEAARALRLRHIVLTMVARDDLHDGGAGHVKSVVELLKQQLPETTCEVLTSDFEAKKEALDIIATAPIEIFNHNVETVPRLSSKVRHKATFERSLFVLRAMRQTNPAVLIKSGLMLGLGERQDEVVETLKQLRDAGCDIVTIGQYLQPSRRKLQVNSYISPEEFEGYANIGKELGISHVYAGPFVRSSYNAHLFIKRDGKQLTIESD